MALFNSLKNLIGMGNSNVLGIDIGTSSIKVVELKKNGSNLALQTYGEIALGPYDNKSVGEVTSLDADKIATALKEILEKIHVTTHHAVLSIPSSASLLFLLDLPESSQKNLEEIIPNEARKFIPVPLTEVKLDWMMVPTLLQSPDQDGLVKQTEKKIKVLVAATRNEAITSYVNILAQAGITSLGFEIEVFALVRSCIRRELSPIVVVDMGASKTRVSVVHHGVVFTTQMLGRGSNALTQAIARTLNISFDKAEQLKREEGFNSTHKDVVSLIDNFSKQLFNEIQAVVTRYEKDYHHAVEKMICVGGGSLLPGLIQSLQDLHTIEIVTSDSFTMLERPKFLESVLKQIDGQFALSIGLALREISK